MIKSLKELSGYKIVALDGEVGTVEDFFFDANEWTVRYLVVLAGSWLNRRHLLFSPASIGASEDQEDSLKINLNTERIEGSPPVDLERPISREKETELHEYYDWPLYWTNFGPPSYPLVEMITEMRDKTGREESAQTAGYLHSLEEVDSYNLEARDGSIGRIQDFLVDKTNWKIQYLVIETSAWLPGRKVIIAPSWIEEIAWDEKTVRIDLTRETIRNSPEYDPETPLDLEYEEKLYSHYQRKR
jgi:sporulation protein YlmC with PRC-barrel domain